MVRHSTDLIREASVSVCATSTLWFYIKSWLQDLRDAIVMEDAASVEIISWQVEETAVALVSAIRHGRIFRIDIDDSPIVFGERCFAFANGMADLCTLDALAALERVDRFQAELSREATGDPQWIANAVESGHIKVLRGAARELSIVAQFGVGDLMPKDWLL
jgi:hypothetical protein